MRNGPGPDARSDGHDEMKAAYARTGEAIEHAVEWFCEQNPTSPADHARVTMLILSLYLETVQVDELIAERVEQAWLDRLNDIDDT
jgi:hypothetical protein